MTKTKFLLTTIAVLLCSVKANAYDFEVDGLYYNLLSATEKTCELVGCQSGIHDIDVPANVTTRGMTLTINSIKKAAFENDTNVVSVSFLESSLTKVVENAFKGCTNLKQVKLSTLLDTIENGAFDGCPIDTMVIPTSIKFVGSKALSSVSRIEISNNNDTIYFSDSIPTLTSAFIGRNVSHSFVANTPISRITLGTGITEIIPHMFEGCKQLEEISIPANIVKIGNNAFKGCDNLTALTIEDSDSLLTLGTSTTWTYNHVITGNGIYTVYDCAHKGLFILAPIKQLYVGRNLSYLNTSNRGEYIGQTIGGTEMYGRYTATILLDNYNYAGSPFNGDVEVVQIGNKVTQLGNFFFEDSNIDVFKVPDNCTIIGEYCFYNCDSLESIDLNNVNQIEARAFSGCQNLQHINWGKTKIIGDHAFSECCHIASIELTDIDTICQYAFANCSGLKKITIGNNVKSIQQLAFSSCYNLHMASIGDGISVLPKYCFSSCNTLQWISLGANLSQIQEGAFSRCEQITNIEVKNITPPEFDNVNELSAINKFDATLYIPQGTISDYEQANVWKDFLFKQECEIPEYIYTIPKIDETEFANKNVTINGDLTGAIINQINANANIETLDLQTATMAFDNQNVYYESGERVENHWDDVDVVRGAPYYSYKYYTAPATVSNSENEYNNSGRLINVITTCFSSELTNANLNGHLKSIKLPSALTKIGENAIKGTSLADLYVYSTTPPMATTNSFGNTNTTTCILHVPEGCKTAYENAIGWRSFKNIVETISDNYIMVQPSDGNRLVELARNDSNATYQWYNYVNKVDKVIDITHVLSNISGWENSSNGWQSNMHNMESSAVLTYEHTFDIGDILSFDWEVSCEETFDQFQVYLNDELLLVKSGDISGSFSKEFDTSTKCKLKFIYTKDNIIDKGNDGVQIRNVKITSLSEQTVMVPEIIEEEISNKLTIKSSQYDGNKIFCMVTLGDGKQLKSNDFVWTYKNFIKNHPTINNLLIELDTPDDSATYQWHQYVESIIYHNEIIPTPSAGAWKYSKSDTASTWYVFGMETLSAMKTEIEIKAGDTLSFDWSVPSGTSLKCYFDGLVIGAVFSENGSSGTWQRVFNKDQEFTIRFECSQSFVNKTTISNLRIIRPSGFSTISEDKEIIGATTAKLNDTLALDGRRIYCVATLSNDSALVSEEVILPEYALTYLVNNIVYYIDSIGYRRKIIAPKKPIKEGYVFEKWDELPAMMPAEDITVTASFTTNTYTITYMIDSAVYATDSIAYGDTIIFHEEPVKDGYSYRWYETNILRGKAPNPLQYSQEFGTWFFQISCTDPTKPMYKYVAMFSWFGPEDNYFGTYTTDDFVCKATTSEIDSEIWVYTPTPTYPNTLVGTITYKEINMNITKIQEEDSSFYVNIDATIVGEDGNTYKVITDKNNKYKTPTIMPARNMLLVGSPLPNTYEVTYVVDGVVYATDSVTYGDTIILLEEPIQEGYTFSGWSEIPETMPAEDIVVTGSFVRNTYTITYVVDSVVYATDSITYGDTITLLDEPTQEGYTFSGWSDAPVTMPAEDIIIEGSFNVNYYALKYIVDNEPFATDSLAYGDTIILREEPQKEDFEFSGWSEVPETMPAHDVEVYGNFIFTSVTDVKVDSEQSQKVVEDNQLFIILPNGKKFNVMGQEVGN